MIGAKRFTNFFIRREFTGDFGIHVIGVPKALSFAIWSVGVDKVKRLVTHLLADPNFLLMNAARSIWVWVLLELADIRCLVNESTIDLKAVVLNASKTKGKLGDVAAIEFITRIP